MAGWVALQILSSKDVKVRASIMKYFVQTAIVRPHSSSHYLVQRLTFAGTTELEQLLIDGGCSSWTQLGADHSTEADQGAIERQDGLAQGESGRYARFVKEFRKLQRYAQDYQPALCPFLRYVPSPLSPSTFVS